MRTGAAQIETADEAAAAAVVYVGEVMHARFETDGPSLQLSRHEACLIDLDRLEAADRQSPLFGVNRAALYSFAEADHSDRHGSPLCAYAQRCAALHGVDLTGGRVLLLCYPRLLGYTFHPCRSISAIEACGELALIIYEVRNTLGEIHAYVLPVQPDQIKRRRGAAEPGQIVPRFALHRDGDALPFSGVAGRKKASSCASWSLTTMVRCSRQLSMAAAARSTPRSCCARLRLAATAAENSRCDPLGGVAARVKGARLGAASQRRPQPRLATRESRDYTSAVLSAGGRIEAGR